jgi:hypothetical protein
MNDSEAKHCHEAMLKFIRRQGEDKILTIKKQEQEEFAKERSQYIE